MSEDKPKSNRFFSGVVLGAVVSVLTMTGTAAVAGTSVGGLLHLGKTNKSNHTTSLTGSANKPLLAITNKSKKSHSTGLSIKVPAGHAPLAVSSSTKVKNLNADKLDGLSSGQFQRPQVSPCPGNEAVNAIAQDGEPTCQTSVVIPISSTVNAGTAKVITTDPAPILIRLDCHDNNTDVLVANNDTAPASLNWLVDDGTTATATGVDLAARGAGDDEAFSFAGKRLEGQIIYKGAAFVATIDIHAFDGTSSCEFAGTVTVAANPTTN